MRRIAAVLLSCISCAAADRRSVSSEIERRTGHKIAPAAPGRERGLPPGVVLTEALGADDAVAIALWNNAALQADLARLGLAQADLIEAGLLRNPNFSLLLPVGPKPFEFALTAPIDAIWQRPRRVAAAKVNVEAVSASLVQHGLDLARDVKAAHAALALAQERAAILAESSGLKENIAQLTERRLAAGDIGAVDLNLAKLDWIAARDDAARAARQIEMAREQLRALAGLKAGQAKFRAEPALIGEQALADTDQLLETAFASRPDLRAAELGVEAAGKRARWERSKIVALGLMLSSKGVGTYGIRTGPGLAADVPLFQRNQGGIRRADAEVERAALDYTALREQVEREVRESRVRLEAAREALARVRGEILPATRDAVKLAEQAYQAGDTSYLTLLEARRRIHATLLAEAEAAAEARRAAAELERSIGTKP
jgi:cobalt-zinc-cadmium efflux system outer membrane protein